MRDIEKEREKYLNGYDFSAVNNGNVTCPAA